MKNRVSLEQVSLYVDLIQTLARYNLQEILLGVIVIVLVLEPTEKQYNSQNSTELG
jgi:hypothetical protein